MTKATWIVTMGLLSSFLSTDDGRHPHDGVLPDPDPARIELTPHQEVELDAQGFLRVQADDGAGGGSGVAILDVNADADVVWDEILRIEAWPEKVPNVLETEVYARDDSTLRARFVIGKGPLKAQYFYAYDLDPDAHIATFRLDYAKKSDMHDAAGHWRVDPHPRDPTKVRVQYGVRIAVDTWLPASVKDKLATTGLKSSTYWLKAAAEGR